MEKQNKGKLVRAHIVISGLVQGVFFRAEAKYYAEKLNIKGWIKNTSGGKVEAVFEGDKSSVDKMIDWCKTGPAGAIVEDVLINWQEYLGEPKEFIVK